MTTNVNLDTGIAYGYISANLLHPDIVQEMQDNGTDVYYADAVEEAQREAVREWVAKLLAADVLDIDELYFDKGSSLVMNFAPLTEDTLEQAVEKSVKSRWSGSDWEQSFNDAYQPDEPVHEGEKDGVKYRTSWLGGALNVWIFESPYIGRFQECSPCVPGAANLDCPEDRPNACGVVGYDVPPEWRDKE